MDNAEQEAQKACLERSRKGKLFKIIKWLVLFVGVVMVLISTPFGGPIVVGTIGAWVLLLEFLFLKVMKWRREKRQS